MATKYEMSKTYQYRKVMKPLLERKRRARINKCLDDLKDLVAECVVQQQECNEDPNAKLEKADILELTVQHLRKLKTQRQQQQQQKIINNNEQSFRHGYIHAANEVSRCLASLPKVDITFGTKLMTHLGLRLNQLSSQHHEQRTVTVPLSISVPVASNLSKSIASAPMYSPVSSGYASDNESLRYASPVPSAKTPKCDGLLQMASSGGVWRPW